MASSGQITVSSGTASLQTLLVGANNDLTFTAVASGTSGNAITIAYLNPGTPGASLSVTVSGSAITVHLATDGGSLITSTATLVKGIIDGDVDAAALVTVANKAGNSGAGIVTAMAATNLTGGGATALMTGDSTGGYSTIVNHGSASVFLGDATVSSSTGYELKTTDPPLVLPVGSGEIIYATAIAAQRVDILSTYTT